MKYQEHIDKIIAERKLNTVFPKKVVQEADSFSQTVPAKDMRGRTDLRGRLLITIDGEDAKDIDDAVSMEMIDGGVFRLGVHIADVSHYVRPKSPLDNEAGIRGTSVYFPGTVIPMLPKALSNGICSLNEGADRLCLSVFADIDASGDTVGYEILETVINSRARMTYTSVAAILNGDGKETEKYAEIAPMLFDMKRLADILTTNRSKRGSIDFDLPETQIGLDEKGEVTGVFAAERNAAHRLIEEFMLTANEITALHMFNLKAPYIYRVHEKPTAEKIENLYSLASSLGIKIKESKSITPKAVQRLMKEAENSQYKGLINKTALRSMMKAKYSPENLGHFGLALRNYCHFTAPIRRYPDLVVHRLIKLWLHDKLFEVNQRSLKAFVTDASGRCSETEVTAEAAERDADDLYKCVYMKRFLGEDFDATISGVTSFGIFAELENTAEGLIWLENLPGGQYSFAEKKHLLSNRSYSFRMGDKIRVKVVKCDLETRKIEFILQS